jgi:glycosyltransferase involved in cell wall biosynthesis
MPFQKANILFINNTSRMGAGTSQSLYLLLRYLSDSFNISVVSDRESLELPRVLAQLNIPHLAFRDRTILFFPQLIFYILSNRIDLVYANNLSGRARVAFWASSITGRPFIWHIRESLRKDDKRGKEIHLADSVIANSEDTASRLIEFARVKNPVVIPNGVDLQEYELDKVSCRQELIEKLGVSEDSIFVINIGRVCEQKNQPEAVRVGIKVLERFPQTHFLFLGELQDSAYHEQMTRETNASDYPDHFHNLGLIEDFIPYLLGSDILLHTARWEPQGRVILEAMAARLPVVAYNVGGVGESVVQGETGLLSKLGDVDNLARDVIKLLGNKELRMQMGEAGYRRVNSIFTAENKALQIKNLIETILSK